MTRSHDPVTSEGSRAQILCREGDDFGVWVYRPFLLDGAEIPEGEHRLHRMDVVRWIVSGLPVTAGPLELAVTGYLTSVSEGSLSQHLFRLPVLDPAVPTVEPRARGRYRVVAVERTHGRRGAVHRLQTVEEATGVQGVMDSVSCLQRLVRPPGAAWFVLDGDKPLPVVARMTTHQENLHENDLVTLSGCKGKWGKLSEEV